MFLIKNLNVYILLIIEYFNHSCRPPVSNALQQQQQQYRFPPQYSPHYPSTSPQPQQRPVQQQSSYNPTASLLNMQARQQSMMPVYMQQQQLQLQQQQQQPSGARWHIPQGGKGHTILHTAKNLSQQSSVNETYKITLKNQSALSGSAGSTVVNDFFFAEYRFQKSSENIFTFIATKRNRKCSNNQCSNTNNGINDNC